MLLYNRAVTMNEMSADDARKELTQDGFPAQLVDLFFPLKAAVQQAAGPQARRRSAQGNLMNAAAAAATTAGSTGEQEDVEVIDTTASRASTPTTTRVRYDTSRSTTPNEFESRSNRELKELTTTGCAFITQQTRTESRKKQQELQQRASQTASQTSRHKKVI